MDINTQNSSGMMNGMPPAPQTEKKVGPIIGVLIIVLILIIAALYFFGQRLNTETPSTETTSTNNETQSIVATEPDDVNSLQADLSMQLEDIDYSF